MKTVKGLFGMLGKKLKPQYNETISSLWYCKLNRKSEESAQEWMGRLRIKAKESKYKEYDRRLKQRDVTAEIIKEINRSKGYQ